MFHLIEPAGILKKYIKNYFIVEVVNSMEYLPKERVYPTGNSSLVFHYGSPCKFKKRDSSGYVEPNLVLCGQQTSYYDLSLAGKTGMVFIEFKPQGLKAFFQFPINDLLDENIWLRDILKNDADQLEEQLNCSVNNIQRIAHLERFLFKRLVFNKDFDRIEHCLKIIGQNKGQVKTQLLARECTQR